MKKSTLVLALLIGFILSSCNVLKKNKSEDLSVQNLEGTWVLTYITGPRITFDGLYPDKKPTMVFDLENNKIGGNTSCNSYGSTIVLKKEKIKLEQPHSTMMACEGSGESVFLNTLMNIESYKVKGDTLSFYKDDIEMMRFAKQQ